MAGDEVAWVVRGEASVGRSPDCDVRIKSMLASRRHAKLFRDGEVWKVADEGSTNGTKIFRGERAIRATPEGEALEQGDLLSFGSFLLRVELGEKVGLGGGDTD